MAVKENYLNHILPDQFMVKRGLMLIVCLIILASFVSSTTITDINFDWGSHIQTADESDNFPMTWHSDGNLYTVWGDGWGWDRSQGSDLKAGLGISRISGSPPSLSSHDVFYSIPDGCQSEECGKSYGIISTGSNLYMWVSPDTGPSTTNFDRFTLYKSTNGGGSWSSISSVRWTSSDNIMLPSMLQFGQGYTGVPSHAAGYVYSYATRPYQINNGFQMQSPGVIYLMRVPTGQIETKSSYQFFSGLDGSGNPTWTSSVSEKVPVVQMADTGWAPMTVTYDAPLHKYIMVGDHNKNNGEICGRGLAVYQADRPWGPWSLVKEIDSFAEESTFFYNFPSKWISSDGKTMWMVFTGNDKAGGEEWDSFNTIKATLTVDEDVSCPGTCCTSGKICSGGTVLSADDCSTVCCIGGTCRAPLTFIPGQIIEAENGVLTSPMTTGTGQGASDRYVYTTGDRDGSASYEFDISQPGDYYFEGRVSAPDTDGNSNSFFVGMDSENVKVDGYSYSWDINKIGESFVWEDVSRRGSGNEDVNEFDPIVWALSSGMHTFTFYGREAGTLLDQVKLVQVETPTTHSCIGSIPTNTAAFDSEESTGLSTNTQWTYSATDTPTKCQYHCSTGYSWRGDACVSEQSSDICEYLEALYHFDGDTTDSSDNKNDGTVNGATLILSNSGFGQAYSFNGAGNYISIADPGNSVLDLPGDFTVSAWVKFDTLSESGTDRWPRLLQKSDNIGNAGAWTFSIDTLADNPYNKYNVVDFTINSNQLALNSQSSLVANNWYFLVVTKSGNTGKVYLDGVEDNSINSWPAGDIGSNNDPLFIGESPGNSDGALDGTIDEVAIWSRALSGSEILDLYNSGAPINCDSSESRCGDMDTSGNGVVEIGELIKYIARWKSGAVTMSELIDAIGKWKSGC